MFHDRIGMRPEPVSGPAFALAAAEMLGGRVIRLMGGTDEGGEIDIAFAAIRDGIIHDREGPHKADAWLDNAAMLAGHGDFWSYETMTPENVERLRASIPAGEAEAARILALATLRHQQVHCDTCQTATGEEVR